MPHQAATHPVPTPSIPPDPGPPIRGGAGGIPGQDPFRFLTPRRDAEIAERDAAIAQLIAERDARDATIAELGVMCDAAIADRDALRASNAYHATREAELREALHLSECALKQERLMHSIVRAAWKACYDGNPEELVDLVTDQFVSRSASKRVLDVARVERAERQRDDAEEEVAKMTIELDELRALVAQSRAA